ncbi:MAG: DUF4013 domain-containing protein [Methanobrevibacter sp.]|jgi:hypothetical protein|nr:DUF4013 domain-containing protein [Candidatus Methanovirga basalitermitum]
MNFSEIFSDSLKYPTKNYLNLIILGIIFFLPTIPTFAIKVIHGNVLDSINVLDIMNGNTDILSNLPMPVLILGVISIVLSIVLSIFAYGYLFSITKNTVQNKEDFPDFKFLDNFVDGIKLAIINFIYFAIPAIILLIIGIAWTGLDTNTLSSYANAPDQIVNNMGLVSQILILALISAVLYIILLLLFTVAIGQFAETEKFGAAFQFKKIYDRISSIGIIRYILLMIVLWIILGVIYFIEGIIELVPYAGYLIVSILLTPYIMIYLFRAIGLIYNEDESDLEPVSYAIE